MTKYVKIDEVEEIVKNMKAAYPVEIFPAPQSESPNSANYYAVGCRSACDMILSALEAKRGQATK